MPNLATWIDGSGTPDSTPKSFYISWIALPVGTYIAATFFLVLAWGSSSPEGKNFVSDCRTRLKNHIDIYRQDIVCLPGYPQGNRIGETLYNVFIGVPFALACVLLAPLLGAFRLLKKKVVGAHKAEKESNAPWWGSNA